ncbi:MAG: IS1182 family transposase [Treponema sp.]|jgi:transposase|nr:IS1182 family transposase [Treponema sp.]
MVFISGENRRQAILMPDIIEDYIREDSAVRVIDAYINSLDLAGMGFAKYEPNETGRPMYDPKDILKLYVYGYMNRLRSSRRLEDETKRNLEVIWLICKLSPDHKTIARFRHDNSKALKNVFRNFAQLCVKLGLYGKELIGIDGSRFKAVNSSKRSFTEKQIQKKIKSINEKIDEYLVELDRNDEKETAAKSGKTAKEINEIINNLKERKERYQGYANELGETGEKQKSLTDPDSRLMYGKGKTDVCYNVQTAVDAENKLIVDFEVTNQGNDYNFITPMAESAMELFETETIAAVADNGYASIQDITAAMKSGVDVHVAGTDFDICLPAEEGEAPVINGHHNGRCVYIPERNIALCPMGKVLYPTSYYDGNGAIFRNNQACQRCTCKCTEKEKHFYHHVRMPRENFSKEYNDQDLTVKQVRIKPDEEKIKQRKSIVEHPFGTVKCAMDTRHCLTKGIKNVIGEFSLTFLAYNLKRAIKLIGCRKLVESMA